MAGVTSAELLTAHEDADSDADDDDKKNGGNNDDGDDQQPAAKPAANVPPALARRRSSVAAQNALIRSFNSKMSASGSSASSSSTGSGLAGASGTFFGDGARIATIHWTIICNGHSNFLPQKQFNSRIE